MSLWRQRASHAWAKWEKMETLPKYTASVSMHSKLTECANHIQRFYLFYFSI